MSKPDLIKIDEVEYVRKDAQAQLEPSELTLVRTDRAGAHYGELVERKSTPAGIEVTLKNSIRVWYWDGAATLSQLAMEGVTKPENCKFALPVSLNTLLAIEIIPMTKQAVNNLKKVKPWKV